MTKDEALSAKHEGATTVALKLALEALEQIKQETFHPAKVFDHNHAITAIREALAQPEQEPVAWIHTKIEGVAVPHRPADLDKHPDRWEALYKTPPPCPTCEALARTVMLDQTYHDAQRKPLTDEEIILIVAECASSHQHTDIHFARAIERAHGIKELV